MNEEWYRALRIFSVSSLFLFIFSSYQAAVSADNIHTHTHWPNARCRRDDTEMDRVLHSVSRVRLFFSSLSARLLLINLSQPTKLTISVVIVTTLILFPVAAVATRRRLRWWRLHHPFRNIGQHIYYCNLFDYDFISFRMSLSMIDIKPTCFEISINNNYKKYLSREFPQHQWLFFETGINLVKGWETLFGRMEIFPP